VLRERSKEGHLTNPYQPPATDEQPLAGAPEWRRVARGLRWHRTGMVIELLGVLGAGVGAAIAVAVEPRVAPVALILALGAALLGTLLAAAGLVLLAGAPVARVRWLGGWGAALSAVAVTVEVVAAVWERTVGGLTHAAELSSAPAGAAPLGPQLLDNAALLLEVAALCCVTVLVRAVARSAADAGLASRCRRLLWQLGLATPLTVLIRIEQIAAAPYSAVLLVLASVIALIVLLTYLGVLGGAIRLIESRRVQGEGRGG